MRSYDFHKNIQVANKAANGLTFGQLLSSVSELPAGPLVAAANMDLNSNRCRITIFMLLVVCSVILVYRRLPSRSARILRGSASDLRPLRLSINVRE
jgi:hypothetical protein